MTSSSNDLEYLLSIIPGGELFEVIGREAVCSRCTYRVPWYSGTEEELVMHISKHGYQSERDPFTRED